MIRPAPRIIAIDDEQEDLDGLVKGLNQMGLACLSLHFTGDTEGIRSCPHVRVIFADLHLNEGSAGSDNTQHFSLIGGLIQNTIKPSGPYVLILWTKYSDEADNLRRFLDERLEATPGPLAVKAIDKMNHLQPNVNVQSTEKLVAEITSLLDKEPQVAALLNWEESVLDATANTVSSIFDLAEEQSRGDDVGRLLARLAVEAVGKNHVESDRFHAVNEALLPILTDRIAAMRSKDDSESIWKNAFNSSDTESALSLEKAAKLNRLVHIASPMETEDGTRRGAVIALPDSLSSGCAFEHEFSLEQEDAASEQFFCKKFTEGDEKIRWVLVQCQAACDYAQNQPGPLPYYLGLELPQTSIPKSGKPPAALWTSPPFESTGAIRLLHVNARFQVSLPAADVKEAEPLYRLREQLLNDLIYQIHGYGSRPGMLSFRKIKSGK